jgi:hypothetical protein
VTPIERLQAAIDKLEALSGEEWSAWSDFDDSRHFAITAWNLGGGREVVGEVLRAEDAHLIATLHRTIDAQLALLRAGWDNVAGCVPNPEGTDFGRWYGRIAALALALADAILGIDS